MTATPAPRTPHDPLHPDASDSAAQLPPVPPAPREARLAATLLLVAAALAVVQFVLDLPQVSPSVIGTVAVALGAWATLRIGRGLGRILASILGGLSLVGTVLSVMVLSSVLGRPESDPVRQQFFERGVFGSLIVGILLTAALLASLFFAWKPSVTAWFEETTRRRLAANA